MRCCLLLAGVLALFAAAPALFAAAALADPPPPVDSNGGGRIVGGNKAPEGAAPWQVEIYNIGKWTPALRAQDHLDEISRNGNSVFADRRPQWDVDHLCGGVLIAGGWVLTAGHCLRAVPAGTAHPDAYFRANRRIRIGSQTIAPGSGSTCAIARTILYRGAGDLGLIRFDPAACTPAVPGSVRPIRITGTRPGDPLHYNSATPFLVYGWGMTLVRPADANGFLTSDTRAQDTAAFLDPFSQDLKVASIKYVPPAVCAQTQGNGQAITPGILCAGVASGKADACQGDSGGPLVLSQPQPDHSVAVLLVGLVEGGNGCGLRNSPGLYTYAPAYLGWIAARIAPHHDARAGRALLAGVAGS